MIKFEKVSFEQYKKDIKSFFSLASEIILVLIMELLERLLIC